MTAAIAVGIAAPFIVLPPPARSASVTQLAQNRVLGKAKSAIDAIGHERSSERLLGSKRCLAAIRDHSRSVSERGCKRSANLGPARYSE
jgi:hypothetical protein